MPTADDGAFRPMPASSDRPATTPNAGPTRTPPAGPGATPNAGPVATPTAVPPARTGLARLVTLAFMVAALLTTPLSVDPNPAHADADSDLEAALIHLVNDERRTAGLPTLSIDAGLTATARSWSTTMGEQAHLRHNPRLGTDVRDWRRVGENVGRSTDLDTLHQAFLDSPEHRENLLDPEWTEIGIGVIAADGTLWVTQLFRLPPG